MVVVKTAQVAPAAIAAHLDHSGAELDSEEQPAQQHDERELRRRCRRPEEDRQKARLEQQRLPPERIEGLPDVHDREIEEPEQREGERRGKANLEKDAIE